METLLSISVGISLSAAAGFRVFVPLLVMSIAAQTGHVTLGSGFEWIGTTPALIAFSVATVVEVMAYYIPWLDNLLDTMAAPAAIIAGVVLSASSITGLSPFLSWSLAIIVGGGVAAAVQTVTGIARLTSVTTTGGLGNPLLSTGELGGAVFFSVIAILIPILGVFIILAVTVWGIKRIRNRARSPVDVRT